MDDTDSVSMAFRITHFWYAEYQSTPVNMDTVARTGPQTGHMGGRLFIATSHTVHKLQGEKLN